MLNREELIRYNRQVILPNFGEVGQIKLKESSVLIVGAGGLGIPNLSYLAAAGIGKIGVVEFDEISLSNLQRQVIYKTDEVGASKGQHALNFAEQLNPNVELELYEQKLSSTNALEIIAHYDLVVDGSDNLPTRYLVNDACVLLEKPFVYGAIFRFEGQLSVFNMLQPDGTRGPNYRDVFPTPPPPEMVPNCSEGGVFGTLAGIIGAMQANEAIKILAGLGETLSGRLLLYDSLDFTTRFLNIKANPDNPTSGKDRKIHKLIDYEAFCGLKPKADDSHAIDPMTLADWINSENPPFILDVREAYEYSICNLGGFNLPLPELETKLEMLPSNRPIVIHCKSGARSQKALEFLKEKGFTELRNLTGGILAWQKDVDQSLETY